MRHVFRRFIFVKKTTVIGLIVLSVVMFAVVKVSVRSIHFFSKTGLTPITLIRLLFDNGASLHSTDDHTNVLLLGIAGGNHDGSDLTDTMMVVSIHQRTHAMNMISIPRDIWSDTLKDKINSSYHYGEAKKKGGGLLLTKVIVEDVIGLPIHYSLLVDFSEFKNLIDLVGGLDVNVTKSFVDTEYPVDGRENDPCNGDMTYRCRYETVTFVAGVEHMDGARILKYVRSRHAEGAEGNDFARGKRQQEVMLALKQKFMNPKNWISTGEITALIQEFDKAADTDMNLGQFLTIGKMIAKNKTDGVNSIAIENLFDSPPQWMYDGRYVLVPKEDFTAVHSYIQTQLK